MSRRAEYVPPKPYPARLGASAHRAALAVAGEAGEPSHDGSAHDAGHTLMVVVTGDQASSPKHVTSALQHADGDSPPGATGGVSEQAGT